MSREKRDMEGNSGGGCCRMKRNNKSTNSYEIAKVIESEVHDRLRKQLYYSVLPSSLGHDLW
jgi:hypothetical protein